MRKRLLACFLNLLALCLAFGPGCASAPKARWQRQSGESLIFIGEESAALAYLPARDKPFQLRSTYLPGPGTVEYLVERDFTLDYAAGALRRTADSRIPDFRTNRLFGQEGFDHSKFPGFGNGGYFAYADYSLAHAESWPIQAPQIQFLQATHDKIKAGESVKIVAFGDSITAGGDASKPRLIFWQRWANELQRKYPRARIVAVNGATGGDTTIQGLQRLQAKVLNEHPDLVLISFGMNDHNIGGPSIPQFEGNLKQMIARIRNQTRAEVVLFSAFPPNPKWKYGTHRMADYAQATARVAGETGCAYADVFDNWQAMSVRKQPEDLLANDINHPNDFGHWIYYRVLSAMGL